MTHDISERLEMAAKGLRSFYKPGAVELIPAGTMEEAAARIRELEAKLAEPTAVTVKPLVWEGDARWPGTAWAGGYQINEEDEDAWLMVDPQGNSGMFDTLEAAKAAAQADYAARILAAIDARPVSEVRDDAQPFLGLCECGMSGPCMWGKCAHPLVSAQKGGAK